MIRPGGSPKAGARPRRPRAASRSAAGAAANVPPPPWPDRRGRDGFAMNANSPPTVDRVERAANPALLLALALVLCCAVAAFLLLPAELGVKAISLTIALLAIFGVFSILLYAFGQLQFAGRASRFDVTKAIADGNSDGLIVTDADFAHRLRQRRLPHLFRRQRRDRPQTGRAVVHRRAGSLRGGLPAGPGRAQRQERGRRAAHGAAAFRRRRGGVVPHPRPPARRRLAARRDAVDGQRHHSRARAPRELLPGFAARHRLSRPRAGRLLLRRSGRLDRPYERDARQLARLRYRPVRRRTAQTRRHRRRRRRGAAQRRLRPSRRSDDGAVRRRPQAPRRPVSAGKATASRRLLQRRPARPVAHAGAQPGRQARTPAKTCAPPKCASPASSTRRRWRSLRSRPTAACCAPTALSPDSRPRR